VQFSFFQVPFLGQGMIIGVNAVIHVLISHGVAIGLFGMLALSDWRGMRAEAARQPAWETLNRRILRVLVLTATVGGAVTGTGIWFTTSALASRGIASMLRIFFYAWFTEWIVFFLEVVAILILYSAWEPLGRHHRRLRVGLSMGYVVSGFLSALLITGNLGFMLTPGEWLLHRSFFSAFLNPSFGPQLVTRLAIAYVVGALIALAITFTEPTRDRDLRAQASRLFGSTLLVSVPVLVLALTWYLGEVPRAFSARAAYAILTEHLSDQPWLWRVLNLAGGIIVLGLGLTAAARHTSWTKALLVPSCVFAVLFVAEFERIRELARGPYLMPGYMYVSGILLEEQPQLERAGMLTAATWQESYLDRAGTRGAGAFLVSQNCAVCHTTAGVNAITRRVRDRSQDGVRVLLRHTQELTSFMPPFIGTEEERNAASWFLVDLASGEQRLERPARWLPPNEGAAP
jgi:mono/diheme cytochrome c family protein